MNFQELDELKAKLNKMRPLNEAELNRLREQFAIENTYNSNAIEGSTLTLRETALVLQEGITIGEKPLKEHLEAIGHRDAIDYIQTIATPNAPLTERDILDIHSLILMNDRQNKGVYRRISVTIMGAVHTPPHPMEVPIQMKQQLSDYEEMKKQKHIIEAIAEFHLRFEGIHPFIDGNGRTGRLIMNLELMKAGFLPINIKYTDKRGYFDCFDHYYANGHTPQTLIDLIVKYEQEEIEKRLNLLNE